MDEGTIGKLKKLVKVSEELTISQMAEFLDIDEKELKARIVDWADEFGFTLNKDVVKFGGGRKDDFLDSLDGAFTDWDAKVEIKEGKLDEEAFAEPEPTPATTKATYHGVELFPNEQEVLVTLEKQLGQAIPKVDEVGWYTFGFVVNNGHVMELGLHEKDLRSLPVMINQLINLKALYLHYNRLTSIPSTIGRLADLCVLQLDHNQIISLPSTIGQLTNLLKLALYDNQLASLPDAIGNLAKLKELLIWRNQLTSIPDSIGQLRNLEELSVYQNQLTSLPETIGLLENLKKLRLNQNLLTSLPDTIDRLANLRRLELQENPIFPIPEAIKNKIKELENRGCNVTYN